MSINITVVGKFNDRDIKRAEAAIAKMAREARLAASPLARMGDSFTKMGGKVADAGKTLTRNLTVPLAGLAYGAKKAIDAASDLAETQSKVGVIFGDSAKQIEAFAATAATSMGQSKTQAMDAAAQFAIFGKSAGLSGDRLVGFSTQFTTLASDLASFNNTSPEEAITAIGAALRGESEPIRRYGVLLDDAQLRQEAMRQGLIKTTKQALTPQQRVLAASALIMKQTTAAQGDFARTSDGLANKQRILKAQFANTTAELGQAFLPVALDIAGVLQKQVIPVVQSVANFFKSLSPGVRTAMVALVGFGAALGPVLTVAGNVMKVAGGLATGIDKLATSTKLSSAATKIWTGIQVAFNAVMALNPVVLVTIAIVALAAAVVIAYKKFKPFRDFVDGTFRVIKNAAIGVFNWLKSNWPTLLAIITGPIGLAVLAISRNWDTIKRATGAAFDWIKDKVTTVVGGVVDFVKSIPSKIAEIPGKLVDFGKNLVEGLWQGIEGMSGWFYDKLKEWAGNLIPGWMKDILGIASPSKVTAEIGKEVSRGMAVGIMSGAKDVQKAAEYIAGLAGPMGYISPSAGPMGPLGPLGEFVAGLAGPMGYVAPGSNVPALDPLPDLFGGGGTGTETPAEKRLKRIKTALDKVKEAAKSSLDAIKARAQDVLDFADGIFKALYSFGSVAASNVEKPTATSVLGEMQSKLNLVRQFGAQLQQLKQLGLNNSSLQDILAAGPEVGSKIAAALLAQGESAITGPGGVNDLEAQLRSASATVADFGAQSQYGMTTADARAAKGTTFKIEKGAINITVGAGADATVAAQIKQEVSAAVEKGLVKLSREIRSK